MTLQRAYYHCESCRTGFCPRDRTLGIDETTLSPAATRMTAAAAARVSFKEASTLLDELAGLAVGPKQVERTAEALGRVIAADERQGRIPDFPVTRSHPPASWPSAANSSICRTYRKTAGEESRRRSPVANRWMRP